MARLPSTRHHRSGEVSLIRTCTFGCGGASLFRAAVGQGKQMPCRCLDLSGHCWHPRQPHQVSLINGAFEYASDQAVMASLAQHRQTTQHPLFVAGVLLFQLASDTQPVTEDTRVMEIFISGDACISIYTHLCPGDNTRPMALDILWQVGVRNSWTTCRGLDCCSCHTLVSDGSDGMIGPCTELCRVLRLSALFGRPCCSTSAASACLGNLCAELWKTALHDVWGFYQICTSLDVCVQGCFNVMLHCAVYCCFATDVAAWACDEQA